jgi:hypothetical protein
MGFTAKDAAKGRAVAEANRQADSQYPGIRGTHGKKRLERLAARREKIIELRDQGMNLDDITRALKVRMAVVKDVLFSGAINAERKQRYNERLLSRAQVAMDVIEMRLAAGDEDVAMWLLEKTGVVGKEQVNIQINAQNAVIPINQEMIDAARLVAAQVTQGPKLLPQPKQKEENSNGNTSTNGIIDGEVTA